MKSPPRRPTLEMKVLDHVRRHRLIRPGQRVLVAFSGGPDSTALLAALLELRGELRCEIAALHIHHGFRGTAADADARFCADFAAGRGVPCEVVRLAAGSPPRSNMEESWRDQRRAIFRRVLRQGYHRVALGHNRDDQAETLLLRLFRGAATTGLGGMSPRTAGGLIRPLLAVDRRQVLAYLAARNIPWCRDHTNRDPRFLRNRIRHRILPQLEKEAQPAIRRVLARTADVLREEQAVLQGVWNHFLPRLQAAPGQAITFTAGDLLRRPRVMHAGLLREVLRRVKGDLRGVAQHHLAEILTQLQRRGGSRRFRLPGELYVWISCGQVLVGVGPPDTPDFEYVLPPDGAVRVAETGEIFHASRESEIPAVAGCRCPAGGAPWQIRNFRPGDTIATPAGRRKLKKVFPEKRIPHFRRWQVSLVCDSAGEIIWIPQFGYKVCYNETEVSPDYMNLTREME